jgi:GT2 family glycosyltransferase
VITVCVPFYRWYREHDRGEEIFDCLIASLNRCARRDELALAVCDGSTQDVYRLREGPERSHDADLFRQRLGHAWRGPLRYSLDPGMITRSSIPAGLRRAGKPYWPKDLVEHKPRRVWIAYGVNAAVRLALTPYVFVSNIDIEHPPDFVERFCAAVSDRRCWFPTTYHLRRDMPREVDRGGWRTSGTGLFGMTAYNYWWLGGTNQMMTVKYGHDTELYARTQAYFLVQRDNVPGLFHIDHPGCAEGTSEFKGTWPDGAKVVSDRDEKEAPWKSA